jgi:plasmid stability protein
MVEYLGPANCGGREKSGFENGEVMVHLTIAVEESLLEEAQKRAAQQGTSVDALLRSYLESYVDQEQRKRQQQAVRSLLDLSLRTHGGSGGRKWTRDELHER